uniref:FAD-binding domain-containing protein n=1 Tax=Fusarium oxysporum (strain Fo5176) TaxID=660025 RepID=A0A0D2XSL2_FUSOF
MGDAMHAMMPNRGMGGNQAMLDAKVMLPFLERLNYLAKSTGSVSEDAIGTACAEYEREMIPRTFEWVEASGGTNPIVPI